MPPPMGSMPPPPGMLFPPGMPPVPGAGAPTLPPAEEIWVENKTPEGKVKNGLLHSSLIFQRTGINIFLCFPHKLYMGWLFSNTTDACTTMG